MVQILRAWRRDRRGAAAVEFAILLPFLVLLAIGVYEYGAYAEMRGQLSAAARSGAQYALDKADPAAGLTSGTNPVLARAATLAVALSPTRATTTGTASYECRCGYAATDTIVNCITPPSACVLRPVANYVKVTVSGTYPTLLQYPFLPQTLPMTVTATLRRK